jgi:hypothetical protein
MACTATHRGMSFYEFSWPRELIFFQIFLSVSVLAVPRVPDELRYVVNKVRSIEGKPDIFSFLVPYHS